MASNINSIEKKISAEEIKSIVTKYIVHPTIQIIGKDINATNTDSVTTFTPLQEYKEITSKEVLDQESKNLLFGGDLEELQKLEAKLAEATNYEDEMDSDTDLVMDVNYFVDRDPDVVRLEIWK
jgi:hypothetical protein